MEVFTTVYNEILLELPFSLNHITEIEIKQNINQHGVAIIKGMLDNNVNLDVIYSLNEKINIKVKRKEKIIFSGIPTNVRITQRSQQKEIELELYSYSILLDLKQKRRSFQNKDNTIINLLKTILYEAGGDCMGLEKNPIRQNAPIIQFDETDWEFIKRIASLAGAIVYPFVQGERPQIYIGLNRGMDYEEGCYEYKIAKYLKEYLIFQNQNKNTVESDFITYQIESIESYELGDKIYYKNICFVVIGKNSFYHHGMFVHSYTLQLEKGLHRTKYYNKKMKGVSIEGTVLAVERDKVKVHFDIDNTQKEEEAFWYPVLTPYTAGGNTGWYVMPEKGAKVLVHMPSEEETGGYVREVSRQDGYKNPKVQNPDCKYLDTNSGIGMKLGIGEISFYTTENTFHLKLEQSSGIEIKSPEEIKIYSEKGINSESETISMEAKDRIVLKTKKTSLVMDDIIQIRG